MKIRWLSNLTQARTGCLTCTPLSTLTRPGLEAIVAERAALAQVTSEGRLCFTCGEWKAWNQFPPDKRRRTPKGSNCRECGHWRTVKSLYGITKAEWEWLLASQDGACALCGEGDTIRMSVDHDHACHPTGRACKKCIRGMLCGNCNRMLGFVEKRAVLVARFADYLDRRPFSSVLAGNAEAVLENVRPLTADEAA